MLDQLICHARHRSVRLLVLLIAGGTLGCVSSRASNLHVPYRVDPQGNAAAVSRTEPAQHDAALALFAIPALQHASLPDGDRELRASTGPSMLFPTATLLRVVRIRGRVTGDVYLVWRLGTDSLAQRVEAQMLRTNPCELPRRHGALAACRVKFTKEPDWSRVGRALDSLDIWQMPSAGTMEAKFRSPEIQLTDQPGVYLERRQGEKYSFDSYYGVLGYRGTPGAQLLAIYGLIRNPAQR